MESAPEAVKQSTVLHRLSVHLDFLAARIFEVEEELGNILSSKTDSKEVSITKLQSLDFTRQSLEDCAVLLHMLEKNFTADEAWVSENVLSSKELKLNSTKSIVRATPSPSKPDASGHVDMF